MGDRRNRRGRGVSCLRPSTYRAERLEPRLLLTVTITPEPPGGTPGPPGHVVEFRKSSLPVNNLAAADQLLSLPTSDPTVIAEAFDTGVGIINYQDSGPASTYPGLRDVGSATLARTTKGQFYDHAEDDNFAMQSSGYIYLPTGGSWTFGVRSDDGARLLMGVENATVLLEDVIGLQAHFGMVTAASAGYYPYQLTWFQATGAASGNLFAYGAGQPGQLLVGDPLGTIKVYQSYDPPFTVSLGDITLPEGLRVPGSSLYTLGAINDYSDPDALNGNFNVAVNWGDGGPIDSAQIEVIRASVIIRAAHSYADEGTYPVTVTVSDPDGPSVTGQLTAHVTENDVFGASGSSVLFAPGQPFTGQVASFTDSDLVTPSSSLTANIDWGDGSVSLGTVFGSSGNFGVSGTHTYSAAGPFNLNVTLTDNAPGTATATAHGTASAAQGPLVISSRYNYDQSPPSISFTFNKDVSVAPNALTVQNRLGGTPLAINGFHYDGASKTATFSLGGPPPNGNYRATLSAALVSDSVSRHLPADYVLDFFALAGDINRDRTVGFSDLLILAQHYGTTSATFGEGDLNGDGRVNFSDLLILAQNYGASVATLAAAQDATVLRGTRAVLRRPIRGHFPTHSHPAPRLS